jgi:hypothetical protein
MTYLYNNFFFGCDLLNFFYNNFFFCCNLLDFLFLNFLLHAYFEISLFFILEASYIFFF